ncbi:MAG: mechanosensitive ion channel [Phycisphaerales bacterium]|jgi:small-conductance mechanosensitive channel
MRGFLKLLLCTILLVTSVCAAQDAGEPVYTQDEINPSLEAIESLDPPPVLETPQSALEFFVAACDDDDFTRAAHALNFRLMPDVSSQDAARLAEKLFFVMNQELWIDWESLPDRPDGMDDSAPLNESGPMIGQPRKSIPIGSIDLGDRDATIRLQRVTTGGDGETPRWLISPYTVQNIDAMYEAHGPGWLDERMPEWARVRGWGGVMVWQIIAMILTFVLAPTIAWAGTWCLKWLLKRAPVPAIGIYDALHWPVTFFIAAIMISIAFSVGLSLPGNIGTIVDPLVLLLVAGTGAWIAMRAMNFVVENIAKRAVRHSHEDESAQQSVLTTVTIVRHVLVLLIAAIALGIVLSQLSGFRSIGIALLSSAGAVALIVGIAGHAVLGNLIAGLQIAFTQPFALGDSVYIQDNYGTIEDITYTYVIVRTWDYRRLVIPIRYFIDNWFENWSLRDAFLVKPIYLHVDYSASIDAVREKFIELVKDDDDWASDRDDPTVLAYEAKEESLIVRLTCAAKDPSTAWDLHCRIREQMIEWLQDVEDGRWLPRQRIDVARLDSGQQADAQEDS